MESSGTAQSNDAPSFHVWARFMGVNKQNKISISFAKYCKIDNQVPSNDDPTLADKEAILASLNIKAMTFDDTIEF